jgi:hypothetical protein
MSEPPSVCAMVRCLTSPDYHRRRTLAAAVERSRSVVDQAPPRVREQFAGGMNRAPRPADPTTAHEYCRGDRAGGRGKAPE